MPVGVTHFDYILECTHEYSANVLTTEYDAGTSGAYRHGDKILCPQDGYEKRLIVGETVTRDDVIVSKIDPPGTNPVD